MGSYKHNPLGPCLCYFKTERKKPGLKPGFSGDKNKQLLLDFGFLEHNVLANFRIKLFDLHFARHVAFVFVSGVVVTSTSCRN